MTTTGMESDAMSDEPETYDATEPDESKWGALRMIGLLALLAAFAGFVYLAYMQGVRNGSVGAPPVITAENGPYKIAPQNPGGETFGNQDKMIFDRVEGSGLDVTVSSVAPPPLIDVAPKPDTAAMAASDDDVVAHRSAPLVVAEASPAPSVQAPVPAPIAAAAAPEAPQISEARPDGIAAAILSADHDGVGGPINEADEIQPKEADSPAPATLAPPASIGTTGATIPETPVAASASATPSGAYVVQIASYRDKPSAEDAWTKFSAAFSDVAGNLAPSYQNAEVPGKGAYVRLRVGPFDSKDAANALCATLKARSQGCLVVKS